MVSMTDPQFQSTIQAWAVALHKVADYDLDPLFFHGRAASDESSRPYEHPPSVG
jgi:hypothetical protein